MASLGSGSIVGPYFNHRHGPKVEGVFYLDTKEIVPPFNEVTGEVPSRLSDNLHPNVVPRHPGHPTPIVHILFGLVQSVEVPNSTITIIFA